MQHRKIGLTWVPTGIELKHYYYPIEPASSILVVPEVVVSTKISLVTGFFPQREKKI